MRTHLRGIVFGFAQSVPFFAYCGCMYYGGLLVQNEGLEYKKVFRYENMSKKNAKLSISICLGKRLSKPPDLV